MKKIAIGVIAAAAVVGLIISTRPNPPEPRPETQLEPAASPVVKLLVSPHLPTPSLRFAAEVVETPPEKLPSTNLISRLSNGDDSPHLTPEQAEAYLRQNRRQAENLLAAFQATGDRIFLREATEKFPNDPRVAFAAAYLSGPFASDEEATKVRRQWLDAFKQSSPDNALANYLSASDHLQSGQRDQAVRELLAAGNQPMQDYALDFIQNTEEACRSAGYSEAEAKTMATVSLPLPQLAQFKQVGLSMIDLARDYRQAGDEASAQTVLQMAINLGLRLDGAGTLTLVQSGMGNSIQQNVLRAMDPNSAYGDSGRTVKQQLDLLNQRRAAIREIGHQQAALLPTMSESDIASYFERQRLFGEQVAVSWAISRFGRH